MTSSPEPMFRFENHFAEMFLIRPSTKIGKIVPVHCTKWPPELKIEILLNNFFSWTYGQILISFYRNVPYKALYQHCSNCSGPLPKMAPELKIENPLNNFFSWTGGQIWKSFYRIVSYKALYQNCSNRFGSLHNMSARAKSRNSFIRLLLLNQWADLKIVSQNCSL